METLQVDLGERSYPIHIGQKLLTQAALFLPYIKDKTAYIVTNTTVGKLYLSILMETLTAEGIQCEAVILGDGEQYKNLTELNKIFDGLLTAKMARQTTMIALGGGVVGDMAGFAAACYQRGVPFIQVPTTLLAQVDSSVGGKTAVNHVMGKNMIGAFYQPQCVIADTATLTSLEPRQFVAGLAEVIKYGLISQASFFEWLEKNMTGLVAGDQALLAYAIRQSCQIKAEIVAQDEHEQGVRALLNLGHTFGHAIETSLGYGQYLHGEAVAIGIMMAAKLSFLHHWLSGEALARIEAILTAASLPVTVPSDMTADAFMELMARDKKNRVGGGIRLILLKRIGQAVLTDDYDTVLLRHMLTESER